MAPWFIAVKFWSDALYKWARGIPGVRWDKKARHLVVPTDVLDLMREEARKLNVTISFPRKDRQEGA